MRGLSGDRGPAGSPGVQMEFVEVDDEPADEEPVDTLGVLALF
ncbi:hypothetical protein P2Q00_42955 [Streptomyces coacervatus]|nr:hypothetical protein [Streptomyces coacervatus]MDF2272126.1 hypothetical protein [Streptomyces coacervatus]